MADRKEDLPLLVREFVARFARQYGKQIDGVTRKAEAVLHRYSWPGNIRELENTIDYACIVCDSARIDVNHLPEKLIAPPGGHRFPQARIPWFFGRNGPAARALRGRTIGRRQD